MNSATQKSQRGSSLLETVVALFVLAIGTLGIMAMQVKSMQFNQSAYYYTQATYLANEILESMRSNPSAANTYLINMDEAAPKTVVDCAASGSTCTPAQLRDFNLSQWRTNIESSLISGKSSIQRTGDFYSITVQFDDSRSEAADAAEGPVLNEYVLVTEIH